MAALDLAAGQTKVAATTETASAIVPLFIATYHPDTPSRHHRALAFRRGCRPTLGIAERRLRRHRRALLAAGPS
jgi:hypothetical protein